MRGQETLLRRSHEAADFAKAAAAAAAPIDAREERINAIAERYYTRSRQEPGEDGS